jgi:hypothetical protein
MAQVVILPLFHYVTNDQARKHIFRTSSPTFTFHLNRCREDEFNCNAGDCVPLDYRCDGGADCLPAGEDEIGCDLLELNASYVQAIPPWGNNSIVLSMTIFDVQDVNVLDGLLKVHLEVNLVWSDFR